jgi:3-oxoacyl-[acyl-carrier protein] reductase
VIGFAKTLSIEVAARNISVNTICPGYIETQRLEKVFSGDPEGMRAKLTAEIPMGRIGTVADVANLVAFLVSPLGRYVTGTAIQVDGGLLRGVR